MVDAVIGRIAEVRPQPVQESKTEAKKLILEEIVRDSVEENSDVKKIELRRRIGPLLLPCWW